MERVLEGVDERDIDGSATEALPADDVPGDVTTAAALTTAAPVEGTVDEPYDQDWFRFEVVAGRTYVFDLQGASSDAGTLGDPFLRLLDADGNELAANDDWDSLDSRISYTASTDGHLFLSAEGLGEDAGTYRLSAREVVDDVPGSTATTATLALDAPVEGAVDYTGDQDWYRFEVVAGRSYLLDLEGVDTGCGTLEYGFLRLLDAEGDEIAYAVDGGEGDNVQLGFSAVADGHVFVEASSHGTGTYLLSARDVVGDVPGNAATTAVLALDAPVEGTINYPSDLDWYRLEVVAGQTYVLDLEGVDTVAGTLADPLLRLLDAGGNEIGYAWDGGEGRNARLEFTADSDGFVIVAAEASWHDHAGTYRLSAREVVGDVPGDPATTAVLALDAPVEAAVDYRGDQDWYRLEVVAGRTYVFDLEGVDTGGGTLGNPFLRLVDAEGNEIAADYDSGAGSNARLGFTADADGIVLVSAEGQWGNYTGSYRLAAREVADDVPGSAATMAVLALDAPVEGSVDYSTDQDWYRVEVVAGRTYVFDLEGVDTGAGTLEDPSLRLLDAEGNEIAGNRDAGEGRNARLGFTAEVDGYVFVSAEGQDGLSSGTYRLSAREVVGDVPSSTAATAALALDARVDGTVDYPGDQDWYRVEVVAGRTYVVDLEGVDTGVGTLEDPLLRLLDADGNEIRSEGALGEGRNARLGFTAEVDGYVFVSAEGQWGDYSGGYRLSAREVEGDVPGSTATTAVLALDAPLEGTIDYHWDHDWYRIDVVGGRTYVFDLEGLSSGAGTRTYPVLSLRDADGNQLDRDGGGGQGENANLGFTAGEDGIVFLDVSGYDLGTYRLSARAALRRSRRYQHRGHASGRRRRHRHHRLYGPVAWRRGLVPRRGAGRAHLCVRARRCRQRSRDPRGAFPPPLGR